MRVLDTQTGQFVEINPDNRKSVYAILSHTWDAKGEQTYEQLRTIQRRYDCLSPAARDSRHGPGASQGDTSSNHERNPATTPHTSASLQLPSDSTLPLAAIGRLTQSEVEDLFRAFGEAYGLTGPALPPTSKSIWDDHELSPKIRDACRVARENGYRYIWIDSCCIDKSSSSELSEAINSMYKWYALAGVCYAFLADVPPGEDHHAEGSAFRKSRWFYRGWTLQELIAPGSVEFLSQDWAPIDSKHGLVNLVESITSIEYKALLHIEPLDVFSVAQRLSWAAKRETTREEDQAYSLLGIFDIHMPTLYGEGERAFRRLQEQIMQRIPDQSLFAWGLPDMNSRLFLDPDHSVIPKALHVELWSSPALRHLFAVSPHLFRGCEGITTSCPDITRLSPASSHNHKAAYMSTPYGIRTQFQMVPLTHDFLLCTLLPNEPDVQLDLSPSEFLASEGAWWYLALLGCQHRGREGHRLGRVCYITPSNESDVELVYAGSIYIPSQQSGESGLDGLSNLFLLPPETIELLRPHAELKTIYIPHPDRTIPLPTSSLRQQPYGAIRLVLLTETCNALSSRRGYSTRVNLHGPDAEHPTMHLLTLSKEDHTITVEFQHDLRDDSMRFTIEAKVKISASDPQLDSASPDAQPDQSRQMVSWADQAVRDTVSWTDDSWFLEPWKEKLDHQRIQLTAAGGGRPLVVDLGLDFAGGGYYFLRVDVLSSDSEDSPAALTV